jgi:hypothetical protein
MSREQCLVDYCNEFPKAILAQGRGREFMALFHLGEPRHHRNGKKAHFELVHRWLRKPCLNEDDQSWAQIMGRERIYLDQSEVEPLLQKLKHKEVALFDHFNAA